ncbi:recombination protein Rad52 [Hortaea werneckii]|uniref:RAD52 homolog n=1 Tax=Hortaea werneckii TaxID=91943 RepID=A0A3M6ZLN2_HORWE|nr:recombination protein Rad52 [Hortaea werneckii]KAI7659220.1 recombination protein Rad52 [Hortaea werneckii]RMY16216.1 hypothetical protein D0868_00440 [Hortaea werneckii]
MPLPGDQHRDTPATTNPFLPANPAPNSYTAREIATLQSRLDKQLGPEYISTRPGAGGGKVHYLAAEKVINLANEVFGFNGWSSAIQNVQIDFVDENPTNGKITLGLSTIVRVTVRDGTFHEDIGYGHIENCKGKAAAFEKAKKEAATDALKRALRNFGNVLGNCLYDKDYLQKVTKLKVAPSKWDAENLHRHPDYAPVKKESIAEADAQKEKNAAAARRQSSMQSAASFGSAEFEEDFGGGMLNEDDFTHPDEVQLDDTSMMSAIESPAVQKAINGPQPQQSGAQRNGGVQRMHSMPHLRPPNVQPPAPVTGVQAPQKPQPVQRPQNNAMQAQAGRMPPPHVQNGNARVPQQNAPAPQNNMQQQRPLPPQNGGPQPPQQRSNNPTNQPHQHQPNPNQAASDGSRSNPSSATTVPDTASSNSNTNAQNQPPGVQNPDGQLLDEQGLPLPCPPPQDAPKGFVTGRSVDLLKEPPASRPDADSMRFNPHADSPSIRRTSGINPGRSAPIRRSEVGGGGGAMSGGGGGGGVGGQGTNGPTTPMRTNFVNPSADANRRIGAPGGGQSMQNRGQYRPPTSVGVKRPALADVSNTVGGNIPQVDGAGDAKKPKVDGPTVSADGGGGEGGQQVQGGDANGGVAAAT